MLLVDLSREKALGCFMIYGKMIESMNRELTQSQIVQRISMVLLARKRARTFCLASLKDDLNAMTSPEHKNVLILRCKNVLILRCLATQEKRLNAVNMLISCFVWQNPSQAKNGAPDNAATR
jgi:hypothetical protein